MLSREQVNTAVANIFNGNTAFGVPRFDVPMHLHLDREFQSDLVAEVMSRLTEQKVEGDGWVTRDDIKFTKFIIELGNEMHQKSGLSELCNTASSGLPTAPAPRGEKGWKPEIVAGTMHKTVEPEV